jgi:glycosyltransferase
VKITIITICFNAQKTIADTICSVTEQCYPDIEYIVVDGGSTDATKEQVTSHSTRIAKFVSESDAGIYDALNKGIALATGDVIGFLNADDVYADKQVLSRIAAVFNDSSVDACYGDLVYVDAVNTQRIVRTWRSGAFRSNKMYTGWMPPHPTFFVRRTVYAQNGGYRTDIGTSADYELMVRYILRCKITLAYIPHTLVRMRTGGISNASLLNRIRAHLMDWKAWRVNGLIPYPWTLPFKPFRKLFQWL